MKDSRELIMSFFSFDNVLSEEEFAELQKLVNHYVGDYDISTLYSYSAKDEYVDKSKRQSKTVRIYENAILGYLKEKFLPHFVTKDREVQMVRDHVTLLKYEKGDFFDWHQDYEKFVMNKRQLYIEGHLLFCISAPESGGELELGYDGEKYSYVQNGAVLFDKLKRHRACKVDAGTKILMAIDVMYKHRDDPMGGDLDAIKDTHGPAFLFDYRNVALYVNQHPEEFVPFGVMMYTNTSEYYERYDGDGNCLIYIYDSSGLRYSEWMTYEDGKFSEEATICEYDGKDHASFNFVEDIGEDVLNKSEDMLPMAFDSKLVLDKAQITMIILEIKHYLRKDRCGNIRYIVEDTCNEPPEEYWNAEFFHGCGYFREGETLEPKVYE